MTIQDILNDIDLEKQKAINELEADLANKIAELNSIHEKNKEGLKHEYKLKVEEKKTSIEKKMQAQANIERKALLLSAKREVLSEVFTNAIQTLSSDEGYEDLLASLLSKTDLDDANVVAAKGKKTETLNAIKKAKKDYKITGEGDFTGGCIVIGKSVEIDLTFETLVNDLRGEAETDIAYKLFN
ncbi:MAG: hypothetical protein Q8P68_04050 [Candidatus Peregrinibacteria bacterium]|nr:hypothetical protein [Candidatus Peregrinibacteria bacterium]MDZ4245293.1 hypothetical protein [Candidatus Gracilibacteria bacterium]